MFWDACRGDPCGRLLFPASSHVQQKGRAEPPSKAPLCKGSWRRSRLRDCCRSRGLRQCPSVAPGVRNSSPCRYFPPQPKQRSSPAVPAKTRPQILRLTFFLRLKQSPTAQDNPSASLRSAAPFTQGSLFLTSTAFFRFTPALPETSSVGAIHEPPVQAFPLRGRWPEGPDEARRMRRCSPGFRPCPTRATARVAPTPMFWDACRLPCKGSCRRSRLRGPRRYPRFPTASHKGRETRPLRYGFGLPVSCGLRPSSAQGSEIFAFRQM